LLDLNLPDAYGLDISNHLFQPFIAMTGTYNSEVISIAKEMGAVAFIKKPFKIFDILDVLQGAIEKGGKLYAEKMKRNSLKQLSQNKTENQTQTQTQTQTNENILIAIGCIIADLKVNQREAYNRIKNTAEQSGISTEIVAQQVLKKYESIAASE
jgi:FixJ family two-component response regulator